jgi:hypothetical protein
MGAFIVWFKGKVITDIDSNEDMRGHKPQPDGKIVVAGYG